MERLLPALSGKIKKGKSDHKSYTQAILPRKTGKKPLQGRQLRAPIMDFQGTAAVLSNIKAAVPYALDKGVTPTR